MQRSVADSTLPLGEALLKARSLYSQSYWYWIGVLAMLGYTLLFNILFTFFLSYLNRTCQLFNCFAYDEMICCIQDIIRLVVVLCGTTHIISSDYFCFITFDSFGETTSCGFERRAARQRQEEER